MAATTRTRSIRTLGALAVVVALLYGGIAAAVQWGSAAWTPGLGLDLAGGTRVILTPVPTEDGAERQISSDTIDDAIEIIRQRVDGSGIGEASVSAQGTQNILVELPGDPQDQQETLELIRRSAQMNFRPVLTVAGPGPIDPATGQPLDGATPAPTGGATPAPTGGATGTPAPETAAPETVAPETATPESAAPEAPAPAATPGSTQGSVVPSALLAAATPAPSATATPPATEAPATEAPATEAPATEAPATEPPAIPAPTEAPGSGTASDLSAITAEVAEEFAALDCTDPANRTGGTASDPDAPLVTCDQAGEQKFVLGPVELSGSDLSGASSQPATNNQGFQTGGWVVNMDFTSQGGDVFQQITSRISQLQPPQNQFAIVLDGLVISAPSVTAPIPGGQARIDDGGSGTFTQETTQTLANQLRFGSLPVSFQVQTEEQISATLGTEQLQRGILAGLIGLGLVVVYSLAQYRALGLVTVGSLVIAALLSYGAITFLSWSAGLRLNLPGVAGLIIAIGVTADSFIVYFERVRDEVREGRSVQAAVQTGWARARRTIIISDVVQLLAAVILYVLAVGGVQGFAFTLGLTTVIDLLVVVLFTHPMLSLLARTRFFGGGHRLSGFDAEHLGRTVTYAGRGRVRQPASGRDLAGPDGEAGPDDRPPADGDGGHRRRGEEVDALPPDAAGHPRRMTIAERRAAEERGRRARTQREEPGREDSRDDGARGPGDDTPVPHGTARPTTTPED